MCETVLGMQSQRVRHAIQALASNAPARCCGIRPGVTSTTSKRMSPVTSCGCFASQDSAAAMMRRRWRSVTASAASSSWRALSPRRRPACRGASRRCRSRRPASGSGAPGCDSPWRSRNAAARLSAERPSRNAAMPFRVGLARRGAAHRAYVGFAIVLHQFECAPVDVRRGLAGGVRDARPPHP